jgi:hypothetical protein
MANVNSTLVSNLAATPRVRNEPWNDARMKSTGVGILEVSTGEDAGDILRFVRIRSNAVVRAVWLSCDAIASAGAVNIGIYQTLENGGAVVDADFFASAQVVTTALSRAKVTHESGVYGIEDLDKPLWEALGLDADPGISYDIAATVTTDMGGAGTLCLEAVYVDGGA